MSGVRPVIARCRSASVQLHPAERHGNCFDSQGPFPLSEVVPMNQSTNGLDRVELGRAFQSVIVLGTKEDLYESTWHSIVINVSVSQ